MGLEKRAENTKSPKDHPVLSSSTVPTVLPTAVLPTAHTAHLMTNPSSPQACEADKERKGSIKMVILRSQQVLGSLMTTFLKLNFLASFSTF